MPARRRAVRSWIGEHAARRCEDNDRPSSQAARSCWCRGTGLRTCMKPVLVEEGELLRVKGRLGLAMVLRARDPSGGGRRRDAQSHTYWKLGHVRTIKVFAGTTPNRSEGTHAKLLSASVRQSSQS